MQLESSKEKRVAILTGVTGQDGSYLAELLLEKGYIVLGFTRSCSSSTMENLKGILNHPNLKMHCGDITDAGSIRSVLAAATALEPDRLEIYNLAAQSHVLRSFEIPESTLQIDGLGVLHILEAIRTSPYKDKIRFYQASTSELFGNAGEVPQSERTNFCPRSPYGIAKMYAYWLTRNYRESYGLYALNGILYNHESPRRSEDFVTRKITKAAAAVAAGKQSMLRLGNLNARRDWGYAKDYVEAMWRMLQPPKPHDWLVATGTLHSVREFVEAAFAYVGIGLIWQGTGTEEVGRCKATGRILVEVDPAFYRPAEVNPLVGDASAIREQLGWKATVGFQALIERMMQAEVEKA